MCYIGGTFGKKKKASSLDSIYMFSYVYLCNFLLKKRSNAKLISTTSST